MERRRAEKKQESESRGKQESESRNAHETCVMERPIYIKPK